MTDAKQQHSQTDPFCICGRNPAMTESNSTQRHLLITGGTIGAALAQQFADDHDVESIMLTWHTREPKVNSKKITTAQLDLSNDGAVSDLFAQFDKLDGVINAAGFLHGDDIGPEKSISRVDPGSFFKSMEANTLPTLLLAKHARRLLRVSHSSSFASLSARVGSIEDNRLGGWYSYRASKAALNMVLKTLAIEWSFALPKCTVAALHPGTVVSPLSKPFTRDDATGLFSAEESATHLKAILDNLTPQQSGRFWSWDGTEIPW
jgi:NAD(P)-dependent dehydrogenase (short-subunit alcohol dehydrogenase family)